MGEYINDYDFPNRNLEEKKTKQKIQTMMMKQIELFCCCCRI